MHTFKTFELRHECICTVATLKLGEAYKTFKRLHNIATLCPILHYFSVVDEFRSDNLMSILAYYCCIRVDL